MRENINKVSQRGERLDALQDKTDNLAVSAQGFRRGANRVRKQMWWKDMKMRMWLIIGIIVLILIIVIPTGRPARKSISRPSTTNFWLFQLWRQRTSKLVILEPAGYTINTDRAKGLIMRRTRAQSRRLRVYARLGHRLRFHGTGEFCRDLTSFPFDFDRHDGSWKRMTGLRNRAAKGRLVCMMARRSLIIRDITRPPKYDVLFRLYTNITS